MMRFILSFLVTFCFHTHSFAEAEWQTSAVKLSGDPEVQAQGIKELRAIKNLTEILQASFKQNRALALEVIRTLQMREFLPRLFEMIVASSGPNLKHDIISTATQLSSDKEKKQLTELYQLKLNNVDLSAATILELISGLQKYNFAIDETKLLKFLEHPSYEVRIAAVQTARSLLQTKKSYDQVLKKAMTTSPYQVRIVAFNEFSTNSRLKKLYKDELKNACTTEKNDEIKELCLKINQ